MSGTDPAVYNINSGASACAIRRLAPIPARLPIHLVLVPTVATSVCAQPQDGTLAAAYT